MVRTEGSYAVPQWLASNGRIPADILPTRLPSRILHQMTAEARRAIATIRACVASERYAIALHFSQRMAGRGLFWPDVEAVIKDPNDVRSQGMDRCNRPKWIVAGETYDGYEIEIVCAIEVDESGTEFITLYWED